MKGKINREKNIHPHRLGLGGYKSLRKKNNILSSSSDSSSPMSSIMDDRMNTWLLARGNDKRGESYCYPHTGDSGGA
jgi:hypothetical protein